MDVVAIFALIEKGITVAEVLIKAGQSAAPAFQALKDLITGAREGAVTQAEVDKTDALLDSLLAEFNQDI
jgi:hypothetical protein